MNSYIYNYETWLEGHANRKTMMEKLERSLVPYELFEAVGLKNDKQPRLPSTAIPIITTSLTIISVSGMMFMMLYFRLRNLTISGMTF